MKLVQCIGFNLPAFDRSKQISRLDLPASNQSEQISRLEMLKQRDCDSENCALPI